MHYEGIEKAIFLSRPNRFIALVRTAKGEEVCHVKNTGRCKELLYPGVAVYVARNHSATRKTALDLIAVEKGARLVNIDSTAPNVAVSEWLPTYFPDASVIRAEYTYGGSRFDFYVETPTQKAFVEVKGVTLESGGVVRFPDAPTQRGTKHLTELAAARAAGYGAYVFFVVQMENVSFFEANRETDPTFASALATAKEAGVTILCYDTKVTPDSMVIYRPVEVKI